MGEYKNSLIDFIENASKTMNDNNFVVSRKVIDGENCLSITLDGKENIITFNKLKDFNDKYFDNKKVYSMDDEDLVEVNPYEKLGHVREEVAIKTSGLLTTDDEVSKLLEKIIDMLYDDYKFLILPPKKAVFNDIKDSDYILDSSLNDGAHFSKTEQAGDGGTSGNIYSISFKLKVNNETKMKEEYIPFKITFKINPMTNQVEIENNSNILSKYEDNARLRESIKKKFENKSFDKDKEYLEKNIDSIIVSVLNKTGELAKDVDNAPKWFSSSNLGRYLQTAQLSAEDQKIDITAQFRYIAQIPNPYKTYRYRFVNGLGSFQEYDIKIASVEDEKRNPQINYELNTCPNCGEFVHFDSNDSFKSNRLVISNEYKSNFIGCEKCMQRRCTCSLGDGSKCNARWDEKRESTSDFFVDNKHYKAGRAVDRSDMFLCVKHSQRCYADECNGKIYYRTIKCSNPECTSNKSYCEKHAQQTNYLKRCENSNCKDDSRYCSECAPYALKECQICKKNVCSNCSKEVYIFEDGTYKKSDSYCICNDCAEKIYEEENLKINKQNGVFVDTNYKKLIAFAVDTNDKKYKNVPYKDIDGQWIRYENAEEGYISSVNEGKKKYFRNNELTKCDCCFNSFLNAPVASDGKKYCEDCAQTCSVCGSRLIKSDTFVYGENVFCKKCYDTKWKFSDIKKDGAGNFVIVTEDEKNASFAKIFPAGQVQDRQRDKSKEVNELGLIPVRNDSSFICPQTNLYCEDSEAQTRTCTICNGKYSIMNFEPSSSSCKICDHMSQMTNENIKKFNSVFKIKKYKRYNDFKSYSTGKILILKYGDSVEVLYYNNKTGRYESRGSK